MKILTFADLHLGVSTYGRIDPETNLNTRVLNALKSLDEMIDYAIRKNIKVIVFAGDAYKNSLQPPTITKEFNTRIRKALDHGIKVLILDGNHDVDKMETKKSPLNVFSDLKVQNSFQTRFHKEVELEVDDEKVKFVFLPTYHTKESIEEIVENTEYTGVPIVYIFHGTYRGALLNEWNIADKETYIDPEIFDKEGVAAVVSGHLHKHQTMYNSPLVYYVGSLQRVDFSEEKQPKGFVVLDVERDSSVTYDFIELESQKFFTLDLDLIGVEEETNEILESLKMFKSKIKDSILRIRVDVDKSTTINEKTIYEYARTIGVESVLDIQKKYKRSETIRNSDLTEHVNELDSLEMYFKEKENAKHIVKLGIEVIEKAKKEGKLL